MVDALSPTMTMRDFENGYWYLEQLKNFAERIGIPAAKKLRKDELERPEQGGALQEDPSRSLYQLRRRVARRG
jgi:hypothetical protein